MASTSAGGLFSGFVAALRVAFARSALFVLLAIINPFEINQWSEERSISLWQRLTADDYAGTGSRRGGDRITIVYLDDTTIRQEGQTRPLSAHALVDLIDDVVFGSGRKPPAAIFVDLLLTDAARQGMTGADIVEMARAPIAGCAVRARAVSPFACLVRRVAELSRFETWAPDRSCQASTLAKLACIRNAGGIPLLFADPRVDAAAQPSAALDALGFVATTVPVLLDQRQYPLVTPERRQDRAGGRFALYPAAALYATASASDAGCETNPTDAESCTMRGRPQWPGAFDRPLTVKWGIGSPSAATRIVADHAARQEGDSCRSADRGRRATVWRLFKLGAAGINFDERPPCRYTDAIPASLFQTDIAPQELAPLLARRLVLIGAQFADSNDIIDAAPFGEVPGVYYHAMALDNLIEMGANYPKAPRQIVGGLDLSSADLLSALFVFAVALVLAIGAKSLKMVAALEAAGRFGYPGALLRRSAVLLPFACVFLALRYVDVGFTNLVVHNVNLVGPVIVCLLGFGELLWAGIEPERAAFARRAAPGGFLRALLMPRVEPTVSGRGTE